VLVRGKMVSTDMILSECDECGVQEEIPHFTAREDKIGYCNECEKGVTWTQLEELDA
jgi:hypothetical protein